MKGITGMTISPVRDTRQGIQAHTHRKSRRPFRDASTPSRTPASLVHLSRNDYEDSGRQLLDCCITLLVCLSCCRC